MEKDFVSIVESLAGFIQNERVSSYNEAMDASLKDIKNWIREQKVDPSGDNIPDLLDNFMADRDRRGDRA